MMERLDGENRVKERRGRSLDADYNTDSHNWFANPPFALFHGRGWRAAKCLLIVHVLNTAAAVFTTPSPPPTYYSDNSLSDPSALEHYHK